VAGGTGCALRLGDAPHKTSYPPDGFYLYYSGNEVVPACQGECGPPAPRGHRAVAQGQSGATLYAALQAATLRSGARTLTQATVRRLVRERGRDGQPGRVLGVELWQLPPGDARTARHAELDRQVARWRTLRPGKAAALRREAARVEQACAQPRFVRATRAVLLCTGGFIYNPALIQAHAPHTRRGWPVGGAGCDGSGLRLGQSVGAAADRLNNISAWRFITPRRYGPRGWWSMPRASASATSRSTARSWATSWSSTRVGAAGCCWMARCAGRRSASACSAGCGVSRPGRRWR
jgi:3-oxo-5alpha-steroid 4-dehydrogenase